MDWRAKLRWQVLEGPSHDRVPQTWKLRSFLCLGTSVLFLTCRGSESHRNSGLFQVSGISKLPTQLWICSKELGSPPSRWSWSPQCSLLLCPEQGASGQPPHTGEVPHIPGHAQEQRPLKSLGNIKLKYLYFLWFFMELHWFSFLLIIRTKMQMMHISYAVPKRPRTRFQPFQGKRKKFFP